MTLHPAVIALVAGLPSFALGYLAYRRSLRVDKVSEQSGITTGMNQLIVNLQADNEALRKIILGLKQEIAGFTKEVAGLRQEIKTLNERLITK